MLDAKSLYNVQALLLPQDDIACCNTKVTNKIQFHP